VADAGNYTIRKVTPAGVVTTLAGLSDSFGSADGKGSEARFCFLKCGKCPTGSSGLAVDSASNVYVADAGNYTIRKVTPAGVVTTLAGLPGSSGSADGTGNTARFGGYWANDYWIGPTGVAVDIAGTVLVVDAGNHTIRKGYPAPRILNSGPGFGITGGQFGFNLTGPAGRSVVVEASTDLVSWLPRWTNTFTFPATLSFSDAQSGVSSHRFYRARLP